MKGGIQRAVADLEFLSRNLPQTLAGIAQPFIGSSARIFKIRRSRVPWTRSAGLAHFSLAAGPPASLAARPQADSLGYCEDTLYKAPLGSKRNRSAEASRSVRREKTSVTGG